MYSRKNINNNSNSSSNNKSNNSNVNNKMAREVQSIELWRCVIAECLASFFYVFLSCSSTLNWDAHVFRVGYSTADVIQISLAFGLAGCALTQCFGHISGGHFNPCISLATMVTCRTTPLRGVLYIIAQCGGGIAGAALLYGVAPEQVRENLGVTVLNPTLTKAQGFGIELLLSFVLVFTFMATVDPKRRNYSNESLTIGLSITLVHLVGFRLTGSGCNPARSLGPAFVSNTWENHWIYWAGPLAGGLAAGLLYEHIFNPNRKVTLGIHKPDTAQEKCGISTLLRNDKNNYTYTNTHQSGRSRRKTTLTRSRGHENSAYDQAIRFTNTGFPLQESHRSLSRDSQSLIGQCSVSSRLNNTEESRSEISDYSRRIKTPSQV